MAFSPLDGVTTTTRTDATKPVVSVVIPTRNRLTLLREALDAIFAQTFDPKLYEVVVTDNCSTDGTPAMIRELQASAPVPITYHRFERDHGPAHSRNVGVQLARGEFIAFTDSDCRADREWLARGIAAFKENVAFVSGVVRNKPEQRVKFFSGAYTELTDHHPTYPTANIMYRREEFLAKGGFDENLCFRTFFDNKPIECADTDLAWRIKESGGANVFLHDLVMYHEVPQRKPWTWTIDTFRVFSVPALIKRHPQLRDLLLHGRVFFLRENPLFYLAIVGLILAPAVHWAFAALVLPYAIMMAAVLRHNLTPLKIPKLVAQIFFLAAREGFLCAGLIYGSIRFRCVVL